MIYRQWDSDKKFKNQTIELAVRCFAEFIQHIFKVNFKFIPDSSNAIAFTSKNSKNIIGYNFSVEDVLKICSKDFELNLIVLYVKHKEQHFDSLVFKDYESLGNICFGENLSKWKSISNCKIEYSLLSLYISSTFEKINSPLFPTTFEHSPLSALYKKADIDIYKEPQSSKYGLIEISEYRNLFESTPRVFDFAANISFDLLGISDPLNEYLIMLKKAFDFKLSVKPNCHKCYNYINKTQLLLEYLEYGKYFNIAEFLSGKKIISQLYENKMDKLTVRIVGNDIYFEEILQEPIESEDEYVTQLFHFEIVNNGDMLSICHFDHEFIRYSIDDYCSRLENPEHKGNKIKTFKVDNANIPFDIRIIIAPLLINFKNTALVTEYFTGPMSS